jgi:type I restriction enzyme, S subunit
MAKTWLIVPLEKILTPVSRPEVVDPQVMYRLLGAHWYAKGLYTKEVKPGSQIQAAKLYRVEENDFVYNRLFAWKGSFAIATEENHNCYVSNEFPCFTIKRDHADGQYLWRYVGRASVWEEALGLSMGGTPTSRNRLKEEKLLAMRIPLPPLEEQRRIVARIEELAAKIEEARGLRRQAVEAAEALIVASRAELFKQASRKGTTRLDNMAILERGKFSYRPRNDPRFFSGNHPWIQIGEIEASDKYIRSWSKTLNDAGLAISRKFPKGTLLISIAATIGAVGILDFDCCIPDSIVAVTPRADADSQYLYHYLGYLRSHLEQIAPQSAQKNINLEILSPLPIPALPLPEQRHIVAYLDDLQTKVDALKHLQAETAIELDAMLPSILDKAFKGEL